MAASNNGGLNGLYTYDQFSGTKKNKNRHFLWWCAGAHQDLLTEFPSEYTRYAGLGGVVLATFVLASLSAGYALYTVFGSFTWSIFFALIWGVIIFNFDRFLVSTMRKYGVSASKLFWTALPRMLLALAIAITIARPLELKIFEKEVDSRVTANLHKKVLQNDSLLRVENKNLIEIAQTERARLWARKSALEDSLHRLQAGYIQEADGTGGSMKRGIESLTKLKKDAYETQSANFAPELSNLGRQIGLQDSILEQARSSLAVKQAQFEKELPSKVGFLERNKALADLSAEEPSVFWAMFFVSLLIILVETGPILSKLIMSAGPYDVELAKTELVQMAASEQAIRKNKSEVYEKAAELSRLRKDISNEMIEKLSGLQKKNMQEMIERWDRGEADMPQKMPLNDLLQKLKEQYDFEEENIL